MADAAIRVHLRHLHRLANPHAIGTTGDRQLLEFFRVGGIRTPSPCW